MKALNATQAREFVLSPKTTTGSATFTVVSEKTGTRFTYKIAGGGEKPFFVKLLTGSNNTSDYSYLGTIFDDGTKLVPKRNGSITSNAPSFKALSFTIAMLNNGVEFPSAFSLYHEGKCGKCGRKLTDPESIDRGIGPVCAGSSSKSADVVEEDDGQHAAMTGFDEI